MSVKSQPVYCFMKQIATLPKITPYFRVQMPNWSPQEIHNLANSYARIGKQNLSQTIDYYCLPM